MRRRRCTPNPLSPSPFLVAGLLALACAIPRPALAQNLPLGVSERLPYNHPGLVVDLGVGLWAHPLPMDYDGDGLPDLLVSTVDMPHNGVYLFRNLGGEGADTVFAPGERIADGQENVTVSYLPDGAPLVMTPGQVHPDVRRAQFSQPIPIAYEPDFYPERKRADQWKCPDYDGDGVYDLIIGVGDWTNYGWDNAFDSAGRWTRGPLHGVVYVVHNEGTNAAPQFGRAEVVRAGDGIVDVFGAPSPCFGDYDGDGDLDLICGSFLDRITYYENVGTRTEPVYAEGRLLAYGDEPVRMELQMLQVVAFDWDGDGDLDLVVGEEDGRVAYLEHTGEIIDGMPQFLPPRHFRQQATHVKVGALATPFSVDWDDDGDEDLIVGDTAGFISFVENLDGGDPPMWAAPVRLKAGGESIRIQAGYNGSIQGPAEAKWGYTVLNAADWNHDGLNDLIVNSILGEVVWFENVGERGAPRLAAAQPIRVAWEGAAPKPAWNWRDPEPGTLVTQWRTTPCVHDLNGDGLNDLVMLDHEGYLAFYERTQREGELALLPGRRVFTDEQGILLRLNDGEAGRSGRRKLALADWNGDGKVDLLLNSTSADLFLNVSETAEEWRFRPAGTIDGRKLAGHTTAPATVDWNNDGTPDLLVGAEDGFLYYLRRP